MDVFEQFVVGVQPLIGDDLAISAAHSDCEVVQDLDRDLVVEPVQRGHVVAILGDVRIERDGIHAGQVPVFQGQLLLLLGRVDVNEDDDAHEKLRTNNFLRAPSSTAQSPAGFCGVGRKKLRAISFRSFHLQYTVAYCDNGTMGEAKRKREQAEYYSQLLKRVDLNKAAQAVSQVVMAVTDFHGADCLLYAQAGALLLQAHGLPAEPVAGSAAWRVGDGDSDVISHARELRGPQFKPESGKALLFHAWVHLPGYVIDFSTSTLPRKARELDAADGGTTQVTWAPPFLCVPLSSCRTPREVLMAPKAGVYAYVRHVDIEALVLPELRSDRLSARNLGLATEHTYRALLAGNPIRVIGVDESGAFQEEPRSGNFTRITGRE